MGTMKTTPEATHTPTPWRAQPIITTYSDGSKPHGATREVVEAIIVGPVRVESPFPGAVRPEEYANADLVRRAVNSHAALVAALRNLLLSHDPSSEPDVRVFWEARGEDSAAEWDRPGYPHTPDEWRSEMRDRARAALALAEGGVSDFKEPVEVEP